MFQKLLMMAIFFAVTVGIGVYCRRHTYNVGNFVLGGRSVGPWVTAFAYRQLLFSSVVFIGILRASLAGISAFPPRGSASATLLSGA